MWVRAARASNVNESVWARGWVVVRTLLVIPLLLKLPQHRLYCPHSTLIHAINVLPSITMRPSLILPSVLPLSHLYCSFTLPWLIQPWLILPWLILVSLILASLSPRSYGLHLLRTFTGNAYVHAPTLRLVGVHHRVFSDWCPSGCFYMCRGVCPGGMCEHADFGRAFKRTG